MRRLSFGLPQAIGAALLLAAVGIGAGRDAASLPAIIGLLTVALIGAATAVVAGFSQARRRTCWWSLAVVLGLLAIAAGSSLPGRQPGDAEWTQQQQERAHKLLDAAVDQALTRQTALREFTEHTLASLTAEALRDEGPFALCQRWLQAWRSRRGQDQPDQDDLAVVLWRGGQRLGWAGPVVPTAEAPAAEPRELFHNDRWWVLREWAVRPQIDDLRLECQLRLAAVAETAIGGTKAAAVQRQVVRDARPHGRRSWGDAQRGLRVVEDVLVGPADPYGVQPRLRLSVQIPPRPMLESSWLAQLALARHLLLGLAVLTWAAAFAGLPGFWAAAWLTRWFWVQTDFTRGLTLLWPEFNLPADPGHAASMLDPAYFATTFGGGWFASAADALLTAILFCATAFWAWRRWRPTQPAVMIRRRLWLLIPWLLAAGVVSLGLRRLWLELVANANARLIGLQVPLDAWTFWALHAVILLFSLGAGLLLLLLAARLARGVPAGLLSAARPFWLAAGLLLVVLLNYTVLSVAYARAEREWLLRKAEQIVQAQDDWIGFLLEDVLAEMAFHDAGGSDPAAAGGGSGSLRHSLPAYQLWHRSAIRDLGLPSLVEIFDADGNRTSHFATGFLRDFQFEVVSRGSWLSLTGAEEGDESGRGVLMQTEVRRYPTGRERIMRAEIPRRAERGWLRLELPVQSWRVSTLAGGQAPVQDHRVGGYRPRIEVERPLLLMLGSDEGWLDVGFAELPDAAAERSLARLRAGEVPWAVITLDGRRWLCRWALLPDGPDTTPGEGFLLGLQQPAVVDVLLDVGRLLLLDVLILCAWFAAVTVVRRRRRWQPGFQGRFLLGYLAIGVILLAVAGGLADRQTFQRIDREARERTRDGLVTAVGQLHGLLIEQARALAGSEYLDELLAGRLAVAERPLGPQTMRQSIVFGPDGELLLDETLSDLSSAEVRLLLAAAREGPMVVMAQPDGMYLGVLIPIDLAGGTEPEAAAGALFYRQRIDDQLLPALAEVIGGEITLRLDGEVVEASHPGRVLSGENPLLAPPELMDAFGRRPSQPSLQAWPQGLAFTGGVSLPALSQLGGGDLERRSLPAVLAVDFPARERDYLAQRRDMALFLAGLITVLLVTAFGLAMVLTWNIFEPLRALLGATRRLAAGDYSSPLPPSGADEVGRLTEGFQTMRDRLHEAQAVLAARERFLQAVLDQVPVGVVVWDAEGRLAAWNPAAAAILPSFYANLPGAQDPAAWAARLRHDVRASLPAAGGAMTSSDGARTLRVGLAPLELGGGSPHELLVCEDLTEFLAAKKLALNAELARQVAHEIKNPLTPIQLSAQLLLQAHHDRHPQFDGILVDAVKRIVEQVELLRSIASEFSLLGRPGKLVGEPLDLAILVDEVAARYRNTVASDGPRVAIAPVNPPPILGHRESLSKVLGNLMQNSLDAAAAPAALEIEVAWEVTPGAVAMVWSDNGTGITSDVAGRLFDPYFSTKSKGTGLGLAICRNLLDMMGGSIRLANRADKRGTTVTVTLPRADAGRNAAPEPALGPRPDTEG